MIWSMIANVGAYVLVSLAGRQSAEEHHQANLFVDVFKRDADRARFWRGTAQAPALHGMLSRFLERNRAPTNPSLDTHGARACAGQKKS